MEGMFLSANRFEEKEVEAMKLDGLQAAQLN